MRRSQWILGYYYVKADGVLATNEWIGEYYVGEDGRWIEGKQHGEWIKDNNGWWYRNADGSYPHNCFAEVDGDTYYFDERGYIKKGWITEGDKKYYLDESGKMCRSQWILGGYYYVKADGVLATNEWVGEYYVGEDGRWIEGKHGEWVTNNTGKWYRNADGSYPHNGFVEVEGDTYYFDKNGYIKKGWITEGDKKYYLDESGKMCRSQWILGYYYVKADGVLATNEWIGKYYVGKDGRWIENFKNPEDWELPIM